MAEAAVYHAHNNYRKSIGLPTLHSSYKLRNAALSHAKNMAHTQQMSHSENINGRKTVGERAHKAGYMWTAVGENVAAGQTTAAQVMTGWMNSQGHRQNILSKSYKHIGIGVARDSNGIHYWCVVFGNK